MIYKWAGIAGGYVAAALLLWAWLDARDDLAAQVAECNASKLASIAAAETITRNAVQAAADRRTAQLERQIIDSESARQADQKARFLAERRADERDNTIRRLELEAFDEDDIPDSGECLNVFVTSCSIRGVLHAGDPGQAGAGAVRGGEVCADPGDVDGAAAGFSNVTYGDALRYWGSDRDAAIRLNERQAEIRRLSDEAIDD